MADFKKAYNRTDAFEGKNVYSITPGDLGGETWSGISRKANPNWIGWDILDAIPKKKNNQVITSSELSVLKEKLFFDNYWTPIFGDKIKNQKVANDMYDTAVNLGVRMSIKLSQRQFGMKETGEMDEELLNKLNSVV